MAEQQDIITVNGLPIPTRNTRKQLVVGTLILCWIAIAYCLVFGQPNNSLHGSALAWAFTTQIAVLFAYVFGAVFDNRAVLTTIAQTSNVENKK